MRERTTRVEAAGAVDPHNGSTGSLENAQSAFSTATTRIVKLLPMSPDRSVTLLSERPGYFL